MRRLLVVLMIVGSFTLVGTAQVTNSSAKYRTNTDAAILLAAAKAGDAQAMLMLGIKHSNINGDVPHSVVEATRWYRKAAEAGNTSGMWLTGSAFWNAKGVAQDKVEAYKWLRLCARYADGDLRDMANRVVEGLTRSMSPQMIRDAKVREADWITAFEKRKKS